MLTVPIKARSRFDRTQFGAKPQPKLELEPGTTERQRHTMAAIKTLDHPTALP